MSISGHLPVTMETFSKVSLLTQRNSIQLPIVMATVFPPLVLQPMQCNTQTKDHILVGIAITAPPPPHM